MFPVASPETFVSAVDPHCVDIAEEEGGEPPHSARVLFRHGERIRLSKFRVHLYLDDLLRSYPKGQLYEV